MGNRDAGEIIRDCQRRADKAKSMHCFISLFDSAVVGTEINDLRAEIGQLKQRLEDAEKQQSALFNNLSHSQAVQRKAEATIVFLANELANELAKKGAE